MGRITVETPLGGKVIFSRKATEALRQATAVQAALGCPVKARQEAETTIQQAALKAVLTGKTKITGGSPFISEALDSASTLSAQHYSRTYIQTDGKKVIGVECKNAKMPNPDLRQSYSLTGEGASQITDLDKKGVRRGVKKIAGQAYGQLLETVVGLPEEMITPQVSTYVNNRASAVVESPTAIPQVFQDAIRFKNRLSEASQGTLSPRQDLSLV